MDEFKVIIGLEVHLQLKTKSKLFCSCKNSFGDEVNSNVCPVCLGLPGSLPVLNEEAVKLAIKSALALNCKINKYSTFDRKNYFYPDLPKGYQISQYHTPLAEKGFLEIQLNNETKKIGIRRLHLEEDAGKLIHPELAKIKGDSIEDGGIGRTGVIRADYSYLDLNRCGIPLIEIVSEPHLNSPDEAYEYLMEIKRTMRCLNVSDCDMEKGFLRCDANISVAPITSNTDIPIGEKVELKNINSFRFIQKALHYEIDRQINLIKAGKKVLPETRLYDSVAEKTFPLRTKEEVQDYRYFLEPDLPPLIISDDLLKKIQAELPELPSKKRQRLLKYYGLNKDEANILIDNPKLDDFFEETVYHFKQPRIVINWILTEILNIMKDKSFAEISLTPNNFAKLLEITTEGKITNQNAKKVLREAIETKKNPLEIIKERKLSQISDENIIANIIDTVIAENEKIVQDYKNGKTTAKKALIGKVMQKTNGQANPQLVASILDKKLINI